MKKVYRLIRRRKKQKSTFCANHKFFVFFSAILLSIDQQFLRLFSPTLQADDNKNKIPASCEWDVSKKSENSRNKQMMRREKLQEFPAKLGKKKNRYCSRAWSLRAGGESQRVAWIWIEFCEKRRREQRNVYKIAGSRGKIIYYFDLVLWSSV